MRRVARLGAVGISLLLVGALGAGGEALVPDQAAAANANSAIKFSVAKKAAKKISVNAAKKNIGKRRTVVGRVSGTKYASGSNGQPTFLDMGGKYPRQKLTVVIWGEDLWRFTSMPHKRYRNKKIAVTGKIVKYRGKPQIKVTKPSQIKVL